MARTLAEALPALKHEIELALALEQEDARDAANANPRSAAEITRSFAAALPKIRAALDKDVRAAFANDPSAKSIDEIIFCFPGVAAIMRHRLAHELYRLGAPLLARIVAEIAHALAGVDIHPGAEIGEGFFIDHGTGVVIGETAVIGRNVRIYQAVTLGAKRFEIGGNGELRKSYPRHPIVEDDVVIYAGATILGRITIGRGSSIGGNVWLTESVPPGSRITQAKTQANEGGRSDLENAKAPDRRSGAGLQSRLLRRSLSLPTRGDAQEFPLPPGRTRPSRAGAAASDRPEYRPRSRRGRSTRSGPQARRLP